MRLATKLLDGTRVPAGFPFPCDMPNDLTTGNGCRIRVGTGHASRPGNIGN